MLKNILLVFGLFMATQICAQEWRLVWSDEFEGDAVDETKWEFMLGTGTTYGLPAGWGNNEREYYREDNAVVANGFLTITAREEKVGGADYTSARLRTKGKADWKYGRFEIRAKMPIGKGLWPALWMLPTEEAYGGWAASGEIDMVEYLGHESNQVHGTLHFGGQWPQNQNKGKAFKLSSGTFHDDLHVFTFEWEEGTVRWYVDGTLYQTQDRGDWWSAGGTFPAPFNQHFHILINLAVGGNWPGYPDASTTFPQELVIDYVRVYQLGTNVDEEEGATPQKFGLRQNYPNPFNPDTVIYYELPLKSHIELAVYNVRGDKIKTLVHGVENAGTYTAAWDGRDESGARVPSGIYLCSLTTDAEHDIIKMTLVQ